jgi:hypothetical protein
MVVTPACGRGTNTMQHDQHVIDYRHSEQWARAHALHDRHYVARERNGYWYVWDCVSDHRVEFDN